ncbi:MAG: leucine-rich repeat domain-containing protein [Tepidisphaerales bacterium]
MLLLLTLMLLLGVCWGWLYWGWSNEQVAVANLKARVRGNYIEYIEPLGGRQFKYRLGSAGWVLDRVKGVDCSRRTTDADLVHVNELKRLKLLYLYDPEFVETEVLRLGVPSWLVVAGTQVTDAGLVHLKALNEIEELNLHGTQFTDAALVHLKELHTLRRLRLSGTQVTDAGLVQLKELGQLEGLDLSGTQITDAGLAHLGKLNVLMLSGTRITDVGLLRLKELRGLQRLDVDDTQITDTGLIHLEELKKLREVRLWRTNVTAAGVAKLQSALPKAHIDWH